MSRAYNDNDSKIDILKLAIKRAIELDSSRIESTEDAVAYIKEYGLKYFIGAKIDWMSSPEGTDFWETIYSLQEEKRR